jgi:hypothetical protein
MAQNSNQIFTANDPHDEWDVGDPLGSAFDDVRSGNHHWYSKWHLTRHRDEADSQAVKVETERFYEDMLNALRFECQGYQTCLRMPLTLKKDMTTICDRYQINESDLMRRAIVEFVESIQQNPNKTSRYMFI